MPICPAKVKYYLLFMPCCCLQRRFAVLVNQGYPERQQWQDGRIGCHSTPLSIDDVLSIDNV